MELTRGDIIRFKRSSYSHLGIYYGDHKIVHLWNPYNERLLSSNTSGYSIRIDTISSILSQYNHRFKNKIDDKNIYENCTKEYDELFHKERNLTMYDNNAIIARAEYLLGFRQYDILRWNCEHFVFYVRYNKLSSPQVFANTLETITGALLGASIAGPIGLFVGAIVPVFKGLDSLNNLSHGDMQPSNDTVNHNSLYPAHIPYYQHKDNVEEKLNIPPNIDISKIDPDYISISYVELAMELAEQDNECGICMENLSINIPCKYSCTHVFCFTCFKKLPNKVCPFCRSEIIAYEKIDEKIRVLASEMSIKHKERRRLLRSIEYM